jgi:ABC-type transport system involved in multi-copper enzyme maturation permease subunit
MLGWMARDAAIRPGVPGLAFAALLAFFATRLPQELDAQRAGEFLLRTVSQFDWIVILIGTAGLVSWDRTSGFYRTLFSQPVRPAPYYLQRWLVTGAAAVAFVPLTGLALLVVSGSFPFSGPLLARFALMYLLLGGLTFALSTLLRSDWLVALLLMFLQSLLHTLVASGAELTGFTRAVERALPPFHLAKVTGTVATWPTSAELTHALLYGGGLVVLALVVVTYRPLGSGGRS